MRNSNGKRAAVGYASENWPLDAIDSATPESGNSYSRISPSNHSMDQHEQAKK
jgi:hypothetical protein